MREKVHLKLRDPMQEKAHLKLRDNTQKTSIFLVLKIDVGQRLAGLLKTR